MKDNIHPKIFTECLVTCACGNSFTTFSTKEKINVEICSACHPFYTGQQKFVDTEGRIDKFRKKQTISAKMKEDTANIKKAKEEKKKAAKKTEKEPTLKELLEQARKQSS